MGVMCVCLCNFCVGRSLFSSPGARICITRARGCAASSPGAGADQIGAIAAKYASILES